MREHLELAVFPFPDRDALANLERRILAELDTPLNLDGMPLTAVRAELPRRRVGPT
jgi:hypothetical protein